MRKQYSSAMDFVPVTQITNEDLLTLARILADGADGIHYIASWKSRDIAEGDNFKDLEEIEDFAGLSTFRIACFYSDDSLASIFIEGPATSVKWQGAVGAERARRFEYQWSQLSRRPRVSAARATMLDNLAIFGVPAVLAVYGLSVTPNAPLGPPINPTLTFLAVIFLATFHWAVSRPQSVFRALRAQVQPFIPNVSPSPWADVRFIAPLAVTAAAAAGTIASAFANLSP